MVRRTANVLLQEAVGRGLVDELLRLLKVSIVDNGSGEGGHKGVLQLHIAPPREVLVHLEVVVLPQVLETQPKRLVRRGNRSTVRW